MKRMYLGLGLPELVLEDLDLGLAVDGHHAPAAAPRGQGDEPVLDVVGAAEGEHVPLAEAELGEAGGDLGDGGGDAAEGLRPAVGRVLEPDLGRVLLLDLLEEVVVEVDSEFGREKSVLFTLSLLFFKH